MIHRSIHIRAGRLLERIVMAMHGFPRRPVHVDDIVFRAGIAEHDDFLDSIEDLRQLFNFCTLFGEFGLEFA